MSDRQFIEALDRRIDALRHEVALLRSQPAPTQTNTEIRVAVVVGIFGIVGSIITGVIGWAATAEPETPTISCVSERAEVIELVERYPDVWVRLDESNLIEEQCGINEYVVELQQAEPVTPALPAPAEPEVTQ